MTLLEVLARDIRILVRDAYRFDLNLGETTITDLCLLSIVRENIPGVRIVSARGRDERDKGFDWEWFIRYPGSDWIRFSVQAKKLNPATGEYGSLRHKVGERFQIDLLQDFARAQGSVPLYAFYNGTPSPMSGVWNCLRAPRDEDQFGCTLVPLQDVRPIHDARCRKDFDGLHSGQRALPWRCIGCLIRNDPSLFDRTVLRILAGGSDVRLYPQLPLSLSEIGETATVVDVSGDAYESSLGAYPMRIAVVDLAGDDLS